jgi:hypothetical protein
LEAINKEKKAAQDERGRLYQELGTMVRGLVLDRNL